MTTPSFYDMPQPYHDEVPHYSLSLDLYGVALLKVEGPTPCSDRSSTLQPVVVKLNSNQFRLYRVKNSYCSAAAICALFQLQNTCENSSACDDTDASDSYEYDACTDNSLRTDTRSLCQVACQSAARRNALCSQFQDDVAFRAQQISL